MEKYNLKVNLTKTDDFKLNLKSLSKNSIFMSRYKEIMMENKNEISRYELEIFDKANIWRKYIHFKIKSILKISF